MTHLTTENAINSNTTAGTLTCLLDIVKKIDVAIQNTGGHSALFL
jgi:hypothetical protein